MCIVSEALGKVITFYSYKGGTGRSMAVANIGCLLAQRSYTPTGKVLMIDWDLEAPGLHRFFEGQFTSQFGGGDNPKQAFENHPGLIDLFIDLDSQVESIIETADESLTEKEEEENILTEQGAAVLLEQVELSNYIVETDIDSLHLLKAGRFDENYASNVSTFNWVDFYSRAPWLIRLLAERLVEDYQYVLIDSRTGVTDTSGICTMLMPERLVVVFTPNQQSLSGLEELIQQATDYRKQSADLRPLVIFPLPSRIDLAEKKRKEEWRDKYQNLFENLLKVTYNLSECNLEDYFNKVQIVHHPYYAYGEEIAVLVDKYSEAASLTQSYENFTARLATLNGPWEVLTSPELETKAPLQRKSKVRETLPKPKVFDVFLVYNSEDKAAVRNIAQELKRRGIRSWLDEEQILPGMGFWDAFQEVIPRVKAIAIFIGQQGLGQWQEEEQRDLLHICVLRKIPLIPVLLPGIEKIPQEIKDKFRFTNKPRYISFHERIDEVQALDELEWGITRRKRVRGSYGILVKVQQPQRSGFLAMPKNGEEGIYDAVREAVSDVGIQLIQTRDRNDAIFVEDKAHIIEAIRSAEIIIAVCVSQEATVPLDSNVMYELGLAHALGKPLCVIINSTNRDYLSNYILQDIPEDEFINYELSGRANNVNFADELAAQIEFTINRQEFPYLIQPDNKDIMTIDLDQSQFLYPIFRNNFVTILQFGMDVSKRFLELRNRLVSLYKEVEEIRDFLEQTTTERNIRKQISDVIRAWSEYKKLYQPDPNRDPLSDFLDLKKLESLENSFSILRQGQGKSKESAQIAYQYYQSIVMIIEDYRNSRLLVEILDRDEEVLKSLERFAIIHRLLSEIQSLIDLIRYLVYKHTNKMIENLTQILKND